MYCTSMPIYHGYAMPTYHCGPTHACSSGSGSFFWRFVLFMLALNFAPVIIATVFTLLGVALRVGLFFFFASSLASLVECAASSSSCGPCPLSKAAKKWAAKHTCPCKPSEQKGETRQCKPRTTEPSLTCCGGPKRTKPPPATHQSSCDVWASAEAYHVTVDVPGIGQDELTVTAQPWSARCGELPRLTVQGATEAIRVHRSLALPRDADAERAAVTYAHGQLKIIVPRAETRALSIPVQHAPAPAAAAPATDAPVGAPPVLREVTPDASNVQLPEEAAEEEDPEAQSENEWEELPQRE